MNWNGYSPPLARGIKKLGKGVRKVSLRVLRKAAKPVVASMRENAPIFHGATRDAINVARGKNDMLYIGVLTKYRQEYGLAQKEYYGRLRKSKGGVIQPSRYAYIVNAKGASRGWFDRCWDATKNAAGADIVSGMIKEVDVELAKIPRRTIINL